MTGIHSSSPFRNSKPHPQIRSETLGIPRRSLELVPTRATTPVSNYFRSVRRRWNPRVPLRLSRREIHPDAFDSSIRSTVHPQSTILCSALARVVFSGEPPPLLYLGFLRVLRFPIHARPPSPSSSLPWRATPPLPCFPTAAAAGPAGSPTRALANRCPLPSSSPSHVERKEKRAGRRWQFCNLSPVLF
jgi:hypothetical protein